MSMDGGGAAVRGGAAAGGSGAQKGLPAAELHSRLLALLPQLDDGRVNLEETKYESESSKFESLSSAGSACQGLEGITL